MVFEQEGCIRTPSPLAPIAYEPKSYDGEQATEGSSRIQVLQSQELPIPPSKQVQQNDPIPIPQAPHQERSLSDPIVTLPAIVTQAVSDPSSESIDFEFPLSVQAIASSRGSVDEAERVQQFKHVTSPLQVGRPTRAHLASLSTSSRSITLLPSQSIASTDPAPLLGPSAVGKGTDSTSQFMDVLDPSMAITQISSFSPSRSSPVRLDPYVPVENHSTADRVPSARGNGKGFWTPLLEGRQNESKDIKLAPFESDIGQLDNQKSATQGLGIEMLDSVSSSEVFELEKSRELAEVVGEATRRSLEVLPPAMEIRHDLVESQAETQITLPLSAIGNLDHSTLEDIRRRHEGYDAPQSANSTIESSLSTSHSASEDSASDAAEIDWKADENTHANDTESEDAEENEGTRPITPFFTKAFEGLPFGPDVPAVRIGVTRCFDLVPSFALTWQ